MSLDLLGQEEVMLSVADSRVAHVVATFNCQHNLESLGKSLNKSCLGQLGLWTCLWETVSVTSTDVRRPRLKVSDIVTRLASWAI